jgi:NADPH:quinone reductase-like Zn-dependent oxidoreductase
MAQTELPATMRAATFTSTAGGLEKTIHFNPSTTLPANATSLPPDSTLVKVAYASPNPVDYKLPENFIFDRFVLPKAKDGSAIPVGDFAGEVIATTLPNLKPGKKRFQPKPPSYRQLTELPLRPLGIENLADIEPHGF